MSYSDYSPYGTVLDNRHGNDNTYRYGFQGQERDDEIKGAGNSYNYEYRMHDPRIGRFLSLDPDENAYPFMSPYCFAANNPTLLIDLEGRGPILPSYVRAAIMLNAFLNTSWHNESYGKYIGIQYDKVAKSATVFSTVSMGNIELRVGIVIKESMSRKEKVNIMDGWGMSNSTSYEYYLYKAEMTDSWSIYGNWLDNYYLDKPPLPVEMLARFVMAVPGTIYGWSTEKDWLTGETLSTLDKALGILDLIPGESLVKLGVTALVIKIADDFVAIFGDYIRAEGGTVVKKTFKSNLEGGIMHNGKILTTNGRHDLVEVTLDGKTYIYDNMTSKGLPKDEYIKSLEVDVIQSNGTVKLYSGQAAYDLFQKR